jgi:hypothetical protein
MKTISVNCGKIKRDKWKKSILHMCRASKWPTTPGYKGAFERLHCICDKLHKALPGKGRKELPNSWGATAKGLDAETSIH